MSDNSLVQIKIEIQKQIGLTIEKPIHLKILQVAIENTTGEIIGYNTLRRFFGFLNETSPNSKTLNVLSRFLGQNSYNDFKKHYLKDNDWLIWMRIIEIENREIILESDILWLMDQINTQDYHIKIGSIIKAFIYNKNYIALNQIFDYRLFSIDESTKLKLALNICLLFQNLSEKNYKQIIKKIVSNTVFRENILHWFIDYSHFNGYYGAFINASLKYSIKGSHEELFCELIINYNNYLSNKNKLKYIEASRIKDSFFEVLRGRGFAYNLLYFNQKKDSVSYEKNWELIIVKTKEAINLNLFFFEIIPALIILKDFNKIRFLITNYYEDLLDFTNWSAHAVQSIVLMAHTITLIDEGKIKESKKNFSSINLSNVNYSYYNYNKIFYLITLYHIGLNEKHSKMELNKIELEYTTLINKIGFYKFSSNYLKNYFIDKIEIDN
ncbi:hypothetical protein [Flavobacterium sp.]|uniref:hypothetical protein n=1 Tax=Flavobacterium sp. TaxID=239 RepID=UPI0038D04B18